MVMQNGDQSNKEFVEFLSLLSFLVIKSEIGVYSIAFCECCMSLLIINNLWNSVTFTQVVNMDDDGALYDAYIFRRATTSPVMQVPAEYAGTCRTAITVLCEPYYFLCTIHVQHSICKCVDSTTVDNVIDADMMYSAFTLTDSVRNLQIWSGAYEVDYVHRISLNAGDSLTCTADANPESTYSWSYTNGDSSAGAYS